MQVYVITNLEDGWDCVCGVCLSMESLKQYFRNNFSADWENCQTVGDMLERIAGSAYFITPITAQ